MLSKSQLTRFLQNPAADKVLGLVYLVPNFFVLYYYALEVTAGKFDWFHFGIAANLIIIIGSTIVRRTARRISLNPFFWLVTLLRSYWAFLILKYVYVYAQPALAPAHIVNGLLILSFALVIYSRLSLGRNTGFVPAKRELVTAGAYGFVRHPIHTAELIFFLGFILASYTPLNLFLLMLGIVFVVAKSLTEEHFLKEDADYQEYCKKVPYRWIPWVI